MSKRGNALAPGAAASNDASRPSGIDSAPMSKPFKLPAGDTPPYPPMDPIATPKSPFLARVYDLTCRWVQEEWLAIEAIKRDPSRGAKSYVHAIKETRLTLNTLAKRLDNISQATLLRELRKLNAPPPGEIIRVTRLHFARHLLIHTRMLVRDVALRAGYDNERHFSERFVMEFGCRPSEFRKRNVEQTALKPRKNPKPKS